MSTAKVAKSKYLVQPDLPPLLEDMAREILKNQPNDIYGFLTDYIEGRLRGRGGKDPFAASNEADQDRGVDRAGDVVQSVYMRPSQIGKDGTDSKTDLGGRTGKGDSGSEGFGTDLEGDGMDGSGGPGGVGGSSGDGGQGGFGEGGGGTDGPGGSAGNGQKGFGGGDPGSGQDGYEDGAGGTTGGSGDVSGSGQDGFGEGEGGFGGPGGSAGSGQDGFGGGEDGSFGGPGYGSGRGQGGGFGDGETGDGGKDGMQSASRTGVDGSNGAWGNVGSSPSQLGMVRTGSRGNLIISSQSQQGISGSSQSQTRVGTANDAAGGGGTCGWLGAVTEFMDKHIGIIRRLLSGEADAEEARGILMSLAVSLVVGVIVGYAVRSSSCSSDSRGATALSGSTCCPRFVPTPPQPPVPRPACGELSSRLIQKLTKN